MKAADYLMRRIKGIVLITVLLLIVGVIALEKEYLNNVDVYQKEVIADPDRDNYLVDCGDRKEVISAWRSENGDKFLFLPAASRSYMPFDGAKAAEDASADLVVMKSAEIGAVFISMKEDDFELLAQDKEYEAKAHATVLDGDGRVSYSYDLSYIKSRGNGSFNTEKKPYEMKLTKEYRLLDMPEAREWVLLANAYDNSLMKNKLVQDFAAEYTSVPSATCKPVDLYVNGEYRGNYYLSEKVEVSEERLNITGLSKRNEKINGKIDDTKLAEAQTTGDAVTEDMSSNAGKAQFCRIKEDGISYIAGMKNPTDITGGYLVEMIAPNLNDAPSYFYTQGGTLFKIKEPKYASKEEVLYIKGIFDELEAAAAAEDGVNPETGRHFSDIIDENSWTDKYLTELLFQNSDMDYASMYFYKDADDVDPKLYAGPAWDYDMSLLNDDDTDSFPFLTQMYLRKELLKFPEVQALFTEKYENQFLPYVDGASQAYLEKRMEEMAASYEMNAIRWANLGRENDFTKGYRSLAANTDFLQLKLKASAAAMNKWLYQNADYCTVEFAEVDDYLVQRGSALQVQAPNCANYAGLFNGWRDENGRLYDPKQPVDTHQVYRASYINMADIFNLARVSGEAGESGGPGESDVAGESGKAGGSGIDDVNKLRGMDFSQIPAETLQHVLNCLERVRDDADEPKAPVVLQGNAKVLNKSSDSRETVNVSFLDFDGNPLQTIQVPYGSTLCEIPVPEWESGIFVKWVRTDNNEVLNKNTYLLEDVSYEAEWIFIPYLIQNGLAIADMDISEVDIEAIREAFEESMRNIEIDAGMSIGL